MDFNSGLTTVRRHDIKYGRDLVVIFRFFNSAD